MTRTLRYALIVSTLALGSFIGASGCLVGGSAEVTATTPSPRLVWIADGVWVVENWDVPVYYYDGFYWRYTDGVWFRSSWYDSGFVRINIAPRIIIRHHRPRRYIRYRAPARARVRAIKRSKKRPPKRDNRKRRRR